MVARTGGATAIGGWGRDAFAALLTLAAAEARASAARFLPFWTTVNPSVVAAGEGSTSMSESESDEEGAGDLRVGVLAGAVDDAGTTEAVDERTEAT